MKSGANVDTTKRDFNAHLSSLDNTPLFMKELPSEGQENGEDSTGVLDALQSLTFDGTPDEVAENFKSQGNEYFIGKRYKEAKGFYTQGIDAFPTNKKLQETLLINRAACNLPLENYGMVLKDCSAALEINPESVKAFFRSSKALFALKRFVEAIDCCDHALLHDAKNEEVKKLRTQIEKKKGEEERKEKEKIERERREKEIKLTLNKAFLARGLWIETSTKPPENPTPVHFDPESIKGTQSANDIPLTQNTWRSPDPIRTPIVFPVIFFYPQYRQSDMISHFHEDTTLQAHLEMMFSGSVETRMPWDSKGDYIHTKLNLIATTKQKRILRIGKGLTLREAIDQCARDPDPSTQQQRDGMILQDGCLSFFIFPKGGEAEKEWITNFKAERDSTSSV